jgi:hypothetical protein
MTTADDQRGDTMRAYVRHIQFINLVGHWCRTEGCGKWPCVCFEKFERPDFYGNEPLALVPVTGPKRPRRRARPVLRLVWSRD